ncbi:MAG: mercury resistance system transport protein MerF [Kiloniellaceae bacterium]
MKKNKKLLCTGIGGTIVAALCCFTPLLVVLLGAVGLSAWLGWLDYVLFPALGFFILLTIYAVYRQRKHPDAACAAQTEGSEAKT